MLKSKIHRATVTGVVVHVNEDNEIIEVDSHPEVLLDSPIASEAGIR